MAKKTASKTGNRATKGREKASPPSAKTKATPQKKTTAARESLPEGSKRNGKTSAVGESLPEGMRSNITSLTEQERLHMVREAAYFLAEKRGLHPGYEMDDWLQAEALVKQQLEGVHAGRHRRKETQTDFR